MPNSAGPQKWLHDGRTNLSGWTYTFWLTTVDFFSPSFSSLVLLIIPTIRLQIVVKVDINNNNTRIKEKNNHHFSSIKTKQQLQKKNVE